MQERTATATEYACVCCNKLTTDELTVFLITIARAYLVD